MDLGKGPRRALFYSEEPEEQQRQGNLVSVVDLWVTDAAEQRHPHPPSGGKRAPVTGVPERLGGYPWSASADRRASGGVDSFQAADYLVCGREFTALLKRDTTYVARLLSDILLVPYL